jgi:hypothetical protein
VQASKREPVLINYSVGKTKYEKTLDEQDLGVLQRVNEMQLPGVIPTVKLPYMHMTHERARMELYGITHLHHFFMPRQTQAIGLLWEKATSESNTRLRNILLFFVEQTIWGMSVLARYAPTHFSQVNRHLNGVFYVGSQIVDVSPWYILDGKLKRLLKAFILLQSTGQSSVVSTGDCASTPTPSESIDYIFTDPPFGENIYYADLNFLVESWHKVVTESEPEAIVDKAKKKKAIDYQDLMSKCFEEYHRILKPCRWITVVFSNSSNIIWRAIQEAIGLAGFVVADVRTMDTQQGSFKQVTSTAVKQNLVISAYKPSEALAEQFSLGENTAETAWRFIDEHLSNLPGFVGKEDEGEILAERTAQMLLDRMTASFVQRQIAVPLSASEFTEGLDSRYPKRDEMYFLKDQVPEYDKKRRTVEGMRQMEFFPIDEKSSIDWMHQQLQNKPQTFQSLQPTYMKHTKDVSWAKHEARLDLRKILEDNFLCYDGDGPVPGPLHSYLSTNYHDLRKLKKNSPELMEKAKGLWYVPDPARQGDIKLIRQKALLKEFLGYKDAPERKIKEFRTEAIRAGFEHCYKEGDYQIILDVAAKLPETVIQEDQKLLMYYDVARTRLED